MENDQLPFKWSRKSKAMSRIARFDSEQEMQEGGSHWKEHRLYA